MEEQQIIECFLRERTEESFYRLFELYCARIRRFFLLRGLDAHAAEDMSQEVFVKVFRKAGELREAERFCGWIYAIARNELISHFRKQRSQIEETWLGSISAEACDRFLMESDLLPKLRLSEWLKKLEPNDRDLLLLRFVDGLSYKELAMALNIPMGTVKWRISELRRKLLVIVYPQGSESEAADSRGQFLAVLETNSETRNNRRTMGRLSDGQEHAEHTCPA